MIPKNYQHSLSMLFATYEINMEANLLPNTTLEQQNFDNGFLERLAIKSVLQFLFWLQGSALNYSCGRRRRTKLWSVIGGLISHSSIHIAHILNTYKIPQVGEFFTNCEMISLNELNCTSCTTLYSYFNVLIK